MVTTRIQNTEKSGGYNVVMHKQKSVAINTITVYLLNMYSVTSNESVRDNGPGLITSNDSSITFHIVCFIFPKYTPPLPQV